MKVYTHYIYTLNHTILIVLSHFTLYHCSIQCMYTQRSVHVLCVLTGIQVVGGA
jgi:hypothetical protein